jgi:hypothetical protein
VHGLGRGLHVLVVHSATALTGRLCYLLVAKSGAVADCQSWRIQSRTRKLPSAIVTLTLCRNSDFVLRASQPEPGQQPQAFPSRPFKLLGVHREYTPNTRSSQWKS